jgi:hypothetical protein
MNLLEYNEDKELFSEEQSSKENTNNKIILPEKMIKDTISKYNIEYYLELLNNKDNNSNYKKDLFVISDDNLKKSNKTIKNIRNKDNSFINSSIKNIEKIILSKK